MKKEKKTIFDIRDENKKDNNNKIINRKNIFDNKIEKLKYTLYNYNQFNVDNKKSYINKKNFKTDYQEWG